MPGIGRMESPGNQTRVAFLLPNVESGGTERHVLSLARLLDRSRLSLSLFTTAGGGSLHGEFSALLPVTVFGDPSHGRRFRIGPLEHLRTIGKLAAIFRNFPSQYRSVLSTSRRTALEFTRITSAIRFPVGSTRRRRGKFSL